ALEVVTQRGAGGDAVVGPAVEELENVLHGIRPHGVDRFIDHAEAELGGDGLAGRVARVDGVDSRVARFEFGLRYGDVDFELLLDGRDGEALRSGVEFSVGDEGGAHEKVGRVLGTNWDLDHE